MSRYPLIVSLTLGYFEALAGLGCTLRAGDISTRSLWESSLPTSSAHRVRPDCRCLIGDSSDAVQSGAMILRRGYTGLFSPQVGLRLEGSRPQGNTAPISPSTSSQLQALCLDPVAASPGGNDGVKPSDVSALSKKRHETVIDARSYVIFWVAERDPVVDRR